MIWYAKIEDGTVTTIREISGQDSILEPKLLAHGYRIGEDVNIPCDTATQIQALEPNYEIQADRVARTYPVTDKPVETVRTAMLNEINRDVNAYIIGHYDIGTQQSFTGIYSLRSTPDSIRDYLEPVWVWIQSVMTYYYQKKAVIADSETVDDLRAVSWGFGAFTESKPDVSLATLMMAE